MSNDLQLILKEIQGLKKEMFSMREDMNGMESSLREDMKKVEGSLRENMNGMESSLREDMKKVEGSLREDMKKVEGSLREDMKKMEGSLREDMKRMETSLRREIQEGDAATRLILENDIRPKINILAENHLDLNRKLDEIRKELKRNELLPVRVSILEKDVREIKQRLAMPV